MDDDGGGSARRPWIAVAASGAGGVAVGAVVACLAFAPERRARVGAPAIEDAEAGAPRDPAERPALIVDDEGAPAGIFVKLESPDRIRARPGESVRVELLVGNRYEDDVFLMTWHEEPADHMLRWEYWTPPEAEGGPFCWAGFSEYRFGFGVPHRLLRGRRHTKTEGPGLWDDACFYVNQDVLVPKEAGPEGLTVRITIDISYYFLGDPTPYRGEHVFTLGMLCD